MSVYVGQSADLHLYSRKRTKRRSEKKEVLDSDYKSDVGPCCLQRLICKVLEDITALLEVSSLFAVLERLLFHSKIPRSWN
jgi:hypothetical protein